MSTTDKLLALTAACKCGVHVSVNDQRDVYETAAQWFEQMDILGDSLSDTPADVRAEMIRRDQVVDVQFYPDSPVSFYRVVHWDLDAALTAALACLEVPA